jgi:twitching motility protein PilT
VLSEEQKIQFEKTSELDLSFGVKNLSRFRANIFVQRGAVAGAFRTIPFRIMSMEELGMPQVMSEWSTKPRGLCLVTGPTGSGKSTTLAALIDKINTERRLHIVTIEDPIEYIHSHKAALVNQREVGADTESFREALRYILRQDPDVVLLGEMRDLETMESALVISETGHLVFATLHTNGCVQAINRIIDAFPPHQQSQVRATLSFVIEGIAYQTLMPKAGGSGRVLACEVLVPNAAIRNLIREDKVHQILSMMQAGQEKSGMQTLNQSLANLVRKRLITLDDAMMRSNDIEDLCRMLNVDPKTIHARRQLSRPSM